MINLLKAFADWNRNRIETEYNKTISQYSPEEQDLIRKGRGVELTCKSLEKLVEENPDKEIIPLTGPGNFYCFHVPFTNEKIPIDGTLKHSFVPYSRRFLGMIIYGDDVKYWLKIGELGADILCNCITRPIDLSDAGQMTAIDSGIPVKIKPKLL